VRNWRERGLRAWCGRGSQGSTLDRADHQPNRLFQRRYISRLPAIETEKSDKKALKKCPGGYFHIDIAEVHAEQARLYMVVG
jgi:hypothetical protein